MPKIFIAVVLCAFLSVVIAKDDQWIDVDKTLPSLIKDGGSIISTDCVSNTGCISGFIIYVKLGSDIYRVIESPAALPSQKYKTYKLNSEAK